MPSPSASQFAFHRAHPLHLSHKQKLNSKLACPLHVGQPVPTEPPQLGDKPVTAAWLQRREKFAAFFVANFVPWKQGDDADECRPHPLEPATLRGWMAHLASLADAAPADGDDGTGGDGTGGAGAVQSERTIARGRLHGLLQYANGLTIDVSVKHALTQWRMHSRQMWDAEELKAKAASKAKAAAAADDDADEEIEEYRARNRSMQIDPARAMNHGKMETFVEKQLQTLGITAVPTDQIRPGVYQQPTPVDGEVDGAPRHGLAAGQRREDLQAMRDVQRLQVSDVKQRWTDIHKSEQQQQQQQPQPQPPPPPQPQQQQRANSTAAQGQDGDAIPEIAKISPEEYADEVTKWERECAEAKAAGRQKLPPPPLSLEQRKVARAVVKTLLAVDRAKQQAAARGGPDSGKRHVYLEDWKSEVIKEEFPTLFLMHGPAGAGKTEVIKVLEQVLTSLGIGSLALSAYTGAAVMQLENATTLLTMLSLGIECQHRTSSLEKPTSTNQLEVFKKFVDVESLRILVIDEMSLISGTLLHHVDTRLRHLLDCELPFGGLIVILAGDFHQKTSVGATTMHEALLERYLNLPDATTGEPKKKRSKKHQKASGLASALTAEAKGIEMFERFRRYMLSKTHRFRNDPQHGENLGAMREGRVTDEFLASLKPCSPEELRDPKRRFATIGVVSNVERAWFNSAQALAFARHYGRVLVRWQTPLAGREAVRLNKAHLHELYQSEAGLWEYFVYDAPCVIEGQGNKAQVNGLVNGTQGRMHSLTLARDSTDNLAALMESAGPGGIVTLSQAPAYINIVPKVADKFLDRLRPYSLLDAQAADVVIPVGVTVKSEEYRPMSLFAAMECIGVTTSIWKVVKDKVEQGGGGGGGAEQGGGGGKKGGSTKKRVKSTGLTIRPMALSLAFAITDYKLYAAQTCPPFGAPMPPRQRSLSASRIVRRHPCAFAGRARASTTSH